MLGTAVAEEGEAVNITTGLHGSLWPRAADARGAEVAGLRAWVDRYSVELTPDGAGFTLSLAQGEHVAVLHDPNSRARHEEKFRVEPSMEISLGLVRPE